MELVKGRSEDKPSPRQSLQSEQNYTHPVVQNKVIQIIGNEIVVRDYILFNALSNFLPLFIHYFS